MRKPWLPSRHGYFPRQNLHNFVDPPAHLPKVGDDVGVVDPTEIGPKVGRQLHVVCAGDEDRQGEVRDAAAGDVGEGRPEAVRARGTNDHLHRTRAWLDIWVCCRGGRVSGGRTLEKARRKVN